MYCEFFIVRGSRKFTKLIFEQIFCPTYIFISGNSIYTNLSIHGNTIFPQTTKIYIHEFE